MELRTRDLKAVEYSRSLLTEGDTMVFISYPNNIRALDPMGFPRARYRMVNSENLLKTGSTVFARLLSDTAQARIRRRKGYTEDGDLPKGVKYVLDLTPPNEGDDAVELISELSCPIGFRQWYSAKIRCGVPESLVGGDDEVYRLPASPPVPPETSSMAQKSDSSIASAVDRESKANRKPLFEEKTESPDEDYILRQTIEKSKKEFLEDAMAMGDMPKRQTEDKEVPEYCPIRHRVGIERLLQCIEGDDPKLDSAPKVWTLFVLAKYFDCTRVVLDYITSWLIVEPNCQILEILPDTCLKIGVGLRNSAVTRTTFGILVSEEALSIASRRQGKRDADDHHTTQFLRPKETIDEDWLNCIQHASQDFHDRIVKVAEDLLDERMLWFQEMPEYRKICHFEDHNNLTKLRPGLEYHRRLRTIQNLVTKLRHYVRGRISQCLLADLTIKQLATGLRHRAAERNGPSELSFGEIWDSFSGEERLMTRIFWQNLLDATWDVELTNMNAASLFWSNDLDRLPFNIKHSHIPTTLSEVLDACNHLNWAISAATNEKGFQELHQPSAAPPVDDFPSLIDDDDLKLEPVTPTYSSLYDPDHAYHQARQAAMKRASTSTTWSPKAPKIFGDDYEVDKKASPIDIPIRQKPKPSDDVLDLPDFSPIQTTSEKNDAPILVQALNMYAAVSRSKSPPVGAEITQTTPFFSIHRFMEQVSSHIKRLCNDTLRNTSPDFDSCTLTDTLLCLDDREFKYLPLWAGGNEDGTGGVFDDLLPAAEAGPSGPGPAFHTGLSLDSSSRDGSVSENEKEGRSINTSLDVEDGFTDTLNRRRVYSMSSSGSSFIPAILDDGSDSDDFTLIGRKEKNVWKGKGVDRGESASAEGKLPSYNSDSESSFDAIGDLSLTESDDRTEVGDEMTIDGGEEQNSHSAPVKDSTVNADRPARRAEVRGPSSEFEDDEEFWNESDEDSLFGDDGSDEDSDSEMVNIEVDDDMKDKKV
ncbi:hypothetical protein F5884DRAFT_793140 [Xylogone sp. PMI_703]|nr:hypothetical protein F5884DRAFT_793140 [Xylogone sp. PMI_703]